MNKRVVGDEACSDAACVAGTSSASNAATSGVTTAIPPCHEDRAAQIELMLEQTFTAVQLQRMHDVPVLNPELRVQAVGFRTHQGMWLGVLITPWFMNLLLVADDPQQWQDRSLLSAHDYHFPSGCYRFITAHEDNIGNYQCCSLFSPMFEFADHAAAVETAQAVLGELMNEENLDRGDIDTQQITALWHPEETTDTAAEQAPALNESESDAEPETDPASAEHHDENTGDTAVEPQLETVGGQRIETQISADIAEDAPASSQRRTLLFGSVRPTPLAAIAKELTSAHKATQTTTVPTEQTNSNATRLNRADSTS